MLRDAGAEHHAVHGERRPSLHALPLWRLCMLTLALTRSVWQRQSARGHFRPMSQMVTVGREAVRENV